jgi:ketosteroid isomerase-like protein
MHWPIRRVPISVVIIIATFFSEIYASETPETILIRQTLRLDLSGKRRSDSDIALSAYEKSFVAYNAENNNDPRRWNVIIEGRQALENNLKNDFKTYRYELQRTIPNVKVRGLVATATSLDSGKVVNRDTGEIEPVYETQFWTLVKEDDDWSISSNVRNVGNKSIESTDYSVNDDIKRLLTRISKTRESGDLSTTDFFSKNFIGYDANNNFDPASWNIIFSGSEEFSKYLAQRTPHVDYTINRTLTSAHLGPSGNEAIAMTRETVLALHKKGESKHSIKRNVFWTLSKQNEGDWKVTSMAYNCGPIE